MHHVRQSTLQHILQGLNDGWMIATQGEHTKATEQIEILLLFVIVEIGAFRPGVDPVIAYGFQYPNHLGVQVLFVQFKILPAVLAQQIGYGECSHG